MCIYVYAYLENALRPKDNKGYIFYSAESPR